MIVTVVTPTFNAVHYLDECMQSVAAQTGAGLTVEHIVVDGGSSDGTVDLARTRASKVLEGPDDGVYDADNKGAAASSGELIGFLGSDDLLLPGALAAVVRRFEADRRPLLVGGLRWIDAEGKSLGDIAPPPPWMTRNMMAALGWCYMGHMATFVTRELFDDIGGFDTAFKIAGDYDFLCKALARAPWSRVPETIACFRRTGANLSMSSPRQSDEYRMVAERHASRSPVVRAFERQSLRLYANARNPRWAIRKQVDAFRSPGADAAADSAH